MSMTDNIDCKVAVLVGRFQSPILLEGHIGLLDKFLRFGYNDYLLVLGVPATKATKNNPLDFDSRRRMIQEKYPKLQIMYLKDCNDDTEWSNSLDNLAVSFAGNRDVDIFGSYGNVCTRYKGRFPIFQIESTTFINEDELRTYAGKRMLDSEAWRAGVVWATQNRYPTAYPTVDCAIFNDDTYSKVWLARKAQELKYRFVGGFVDPNDDSFEASAIREAKEESGLSCKITKWLGTFKIDDWRYRAEEDKIITTFFAMIRTSGTPKADDDIQELKLFDLKDLSHEMIQTEHIPLMEKLKKEFTK